MELLGRPIGSSRNNDIKLVPRRARGGSFRGEKTTSQRKNLPVECAQGDQPVDAQTEFFVSTV